ncbi:HlyD family efflux transporter periplasmic adaptor subunit [Nostoc flagelliforme FACHB-838]|uniref:HlyD family efflux transporter periplasmic adaptor subunit n=1 Tax=Nostoc flagelliforme FACHB-838 TaxID=2692904 RepID=A0ABR8E1K5_9NOSO|nr:HlyD family efflux transporter periplasmic adaptor subunit [Nostoc flagelliforme]MBD2534987.1 HlyD family efflux transporter periplasmic adaptor subunit [Nostoc flagelliforme FACHB-838]
MFDDPHPDLFRTVKSDDFLPSIGLWTNLGSLFLVGAVGAAFIFAALIKYNVTVKAPASVRPTGEVRLVQATIQGSVKNILVKENQVVKHSDAIAFIDDSQLQTKKSQLQGSIQQNQLQLTQLDAQIKALEQEVGAETDRSNRVVARAEAELNHTVRDYQEKQVTANSELQEAEANIKIAQNELQKVQLELKSAQADVRATEAALKTAIVKRDRYQTIAKSGSIPQNQLEEAQLAVTQQQQTVLSQKAAVESQKQEILKAKQAVEVAIARRNRALAALNPSNAVISIAQEEIATERATGETNRARLNQQRESLLQRKIQIYSTIDSAQKDLKQIETELQKTIIRTTEAGTILKLELRNPGQVLRLGDAVAQIAPSNAPLIIKARVAAQDISKIRLCKAAQTTECKQGKVQLRVSAYPYPDYGTLKGAVRAITADAITEQSDRTSRAMPYYEVTIQPEKLSLDKGGISYPIQSGMEVIADIIAKEETVLTFILRKARLITDL